MGGRVVTGDGYELVRRAWSAVAEWEASFGPFERHPSMSVDAHRLGTAFDEYLRRLGGNYPFFHPRYAGQMLKPPHPVALAAYAAAQRINPNNHALDGGPPTGQMEKEVVAELAGMFGFDDDHLGHLTGGGTMANLEALFVARELHPGRAVAVSSHAHYTHARMAHVLGLPVVTVPTEPDGRMSLDALEEMVGRDQVGTVVVTPGTTGLGAVDPLGEVVPIARRHGLRVHADAAYGGFFRLLAGRDAFPGFPRVDFEALAECDSIVVDPHKHGLQPYGCGCVLFRDPAVGRFYKHDSPYTYFTSRDLHLGEISLECSRPGAVAGALWLTVQALPLHADEGLGPILAACLRAARDWAARIERSSSLKLYVTPQLDILTFFPRVNRRSLSAVSAASQAVFETGMRDEDDPVFLSVYRVVADEFSRLHPEYEVDVDEAIILRSVLMKPEHELAIEALHNRVEQLAAKACTLGGHGR